MIIIDTSGSMSYPDAKLHAAIAAAQAAIDTLRDGVNFAVVSGANSASMVFPAQPALVPADANSRAMAKRELVSSRRRAGRRSARGCGWPTSSSTRTSTASGTRSC